MTTKNEHLRAGVLGMDCAECALHIEHAVRALPGIARAHVLLAAERIEVDFDPTRVGRDSISRAVESAGYRLADEVSAPQPQIAPALAQRAGWALAALLSLVIVAEALAERLGLLEAAFERLPVWLTIGAVLLGGYPIFLNVARSLARRQVTAHALMTLGILAALLTGEVSAAVVIVFFMRVADYLENLTTERSRLAIRSLMQLAPPTAHLQSPEGEREVDAADLQVGDRILVRPGERSPADGNVEDGMAAVDQSPITGESMPVDKGPGAEVLAGTIVHGGALHLRLTRVGADTTLGRIIRLVEEAEANKAPVQRFADRFTAWYVPVVVGAAGLTYLLGGQMRSAIAVLLVACACAVALATPTAVIASVGRAARQGILIKGGRYLELLARADTLVMDKTGTLTLGRPTVTDLVPIDGFPPEELLRLAASAERYSEHPIGEAMRAAAGESGLPLSSPEGFEALPGMGVRARVDGVEVLAGGRRLLEERGVAPPADLISRVSRLEELGKTVFYLAGDGVVHGALAVSDLLRPEVSEALSELRGLGFRRMILLTGDNERAARALATPLGVEYRAELLPEEKIDIVRDLQTNGATVLMVGDGVNDAPALAQADVGIAMGVAGADAALEAADVALMRDDWRAVAGAVRIGRRAFRVIQQNLGIGVLYNTFGIALAGFGVLPPVAAAAGQSIPDLLVMLNSARLLRASASRR